MNTLLQVITTTASREEAERIGRTLVEERLAACAQVSGPLTSFYRWQGRLENNSEWYCVLKTAEDRYAALETRLKSLHSYDTPEIIALPVLSASAEYSAWIQESMHHSAPGHESAETIPREKR
jgi:periplasmic divalent cation tolerance protein